MRDRRAALAELPMGGSTLLLREAVADDVPALVELLAADTLGASRDGATNEEELEPYLAVRVREDYRRQGLGTGMFTWAIGEARRRGCRLVQLTTDKSRIDAHRFYEGLGFVASHEGLKLQL